MEVYQHWRLGFLFVISLRYSQSYTMHRGLTAFFIYIQFFIVITSFTNSIRSFITCLLKIFKNKQRYLVVTCQMRTLDEMERLGYHRPTWNELDWMEACNSFFSHTFDVRLEPVTLIKFAPASVARALARRVLPVPGGPKSKIPLQGW